VLTLLSLEAQVLDYKAKNWPCAPRKPESEINLRATQFRNILHMIEEDEIAAAAKKSRSI
jgi:hypothetical protein